MNNQNFRYWLQGYFELRIGGTAELDDAQVKVIREHLYLVRQTEQLSGFTAWLEGLLDANVPVTKELGKLISSRLLESFQHIEYPASFTITTPGGGYSLAGQDSINRFLGTDPTQVAVC